ncbi:hypothetical protein LguiB_023136 [Lonicera macranthoides]
MGDLSGLTNNIQEVVTRDQQPDLVQKVKEGNVTLRTSYELSQYLLKMGPLEQASDASEFLLKLLCCGLMRMHAAGRNAGVWLQEMGLLVPAQKVSCPVLIGCCGGRTCV